MKATVVFATYEIEYLKNQKVRIVPVYTVDIRHNNQSFRLGYRGSREECRWMARMFHKALRAHDLEAK